MSLNFHNLKSNIQRILNVHGKENIKISNQEINTVSDLSTHTPIYVFMFD